MPDPRIPGHYVTLYKWFSGWATWCSTCAVWIGFGEPNNRKEDLVFRSLAHTDLDYIVDDSKRQRKIRLEQGALFKGPG